jgi:hypothetical protein
MIKILEVTWLIMSALGVSVISYKFLKEDDTSQMGFLTIFTAFAVIMYLYRRRQRVTMDRAKAEDTSDKYH